MRLARLVIFLWLAMSGAAWAQCSSSNLNACPSPPFNVVTANKFVGPVIGPIVTLNSLKCDGVTDLTSTIQAAVNQASGNAMVYLPNYAQACVALGAISIPSNTRMWIDGTLKAANGATTSLLSVLSNARNVIVEGYGTIDGNRGSHSGRGACFETNTGDVNVTVRNLTIQNCFNWPVNMQAVTSCYLENLTLINSNNSPEFAAGATDCHAIALHVSGITDEVFAFYGGVSNSSIAYSTITGTGTNGTDGIAVLNDASQPTPSHDITIGPGNNISLNGQSGVGVNGGIGAAGNNYNVTIIGNQIHGNGLLDAAQSQAFCGIKLLSVNNVKVSGNHIYNDGVAGAPACYGIDASGTSSAITMDDNLIVDEGQGGTNGVGIEIGSSCSFCIASNNQILDDQGGSATMAFGINGTAGPTDSFLNNTISGTLGDAYGITFAADTILTVPVPYGYRSISSPVDGDTTIAKAVYQIVDIANGGAFTAYTIQAPPSPPNNQIIRITCDATITTLNFTANVGQTVNGGVTACALGTGHSWIFIGSSLTWKPLS